MKIIENEAMFDETIAQGVTLVDFYADWCGPCKMIAPYIKEIDEDYKGAINVAKVNVDEQQRLAVKFKISAIPTLMVFKDGEPVALRRGFQSKNALKTTIDEFLK